MKFPIYAKIKNHNQTTNQLGKSTFSISWQGLDLITISLPQETMFPSIHKEVPLYDPRNDRQKQLQSIVCVYWWYFPVSCSWFLFFSYMAMDQNDQNISKPYGTSSCWPIYPRTPWSPSPLRSNGTPLGRSNRVHPGFLGGTEYHVHELHGSTYIRTTTENLIQNHYNINFRSLQTTLENYTKNSTENSRVFQKDHDSQNGPPSSASKCPSPPRARKKTRNVAVLEKWNNCN